MTSIVYSLFRVIQFPREGKIVTVNQLSFTQKGSNLPAEDKIPSIDNTTRVTESIGVGFYPSLMGTFNFPTPVLYVGSSFDVPEKASNVSVIESFKTKYLNDPWVLPNPSESIDDNVNSDSAPILFAAEIAYQDIQ